MSSAEFFQKRIFSPVYIVTIIGSYVIVYNAYAYNMYNKKKIENRYAKMPNTYVENTYFKISEVKFSRCPQWTEYEFFSGLLIFYCAICKQFADKSKFMNFNVVVNE